MKENHERTYGAIFSGVDVRDYTLVCGSGPQDFPREYQLTLPGRIKDQGAVGSCVAHALSGILEYYNALQHGDSTELSTGYIYGNRTTSRHKGPGMVLRDALKAATKFGDVPQEEFPYNVETPAAIQLYRRYAARLYPLGRPSRISGYVRLHSGAEAKLALSRGAPLLMAMEWYSDMAVVDGVLTTGCEGPEGGHCMFIYGWNETGWLVQNSWGESWGEGGCFILPYEMGMAECWAVMDDIVDTQVKKPFSGCLGGAVAKVINAVCNFFQPEGGG